MVSAYIRLRFACRIYCCTSAEPQRVAASSFHLERQVPYGTHRCNRPALQQTSLQRQFSLILNLATFPFVQEYECALWHITSIRSLHNCKLVCAVSAYIRLRFACRIYCCTSAEFQRVAASSLHLERQVPYGTHRCNRPALQQTSLQRQFSLILDLVTFPFVQEYECALRHMTSIRSLHNCKLVCIVCDFS